MSLNFSISTEKNEEDYVLTRNIADKYVWGFFAHRLINRTAVFLLPYEMLSFYKQNISYLEESAVNPDARRYLVKDEAPRHYIDLDLYKEEVDGQVPLTWMTAVEKYTEDKLKQRGIVPWYIYQMSFMLTKAFEENDAEKILRYSAEIGHYIADANVPLHTTSNYNGQFTGQKGIHGLWESRMVELYSNSFDLYFGDAIYQDHLQKLAWSAVRNANAALDSVLIFERVATEKVGADKKFSFEERNGITIKTYSRKFCDSFNSLLNGMIERRLRASIKMVADIWFTCWVNAGQPTLNSLINYQIPEETYKKNKKERQLGRDNPKIKSRKHEIIE